MNTAAERTLLGRATTALEEVGLKVAPAKAPRGIPAQFADAWWQVGRGNETTAYLVEAKRTVAPATVGAVIAQLRERARETGWPTLLVTDHVTPPVAATLRRQQQQFADADGNAFLAGERLYVYVVGRKPKERPQPPVRGGAFTANGIKILFALLCDPALAQAPQRAVAAAAGVALGAVPGALAGLQQGGHVVTLNKRRRLVGTKRLLDEWALGYARRIRPKTLLAAYTTDGFDDWQKWKLDPETIRWGGEPAAALLTRYLRPGILTLYGERIPARLMVEQRLRKPEPGAHRLLELRQPFWGQPLTVNTRPDVVPPVLIYADLLATGDGRCMETAEMLHEKHLARLLPAA